MLVEYVNKYMDNFVPNQTLIGEIMSFNAVPENLKKGKILDPYLRELLAEQAKYICLNQDKRLRNIQQRIAFVYEGETKPLFEMSKLFDQVIFLLKQATISCSYIRRFNSLTSFVWGKKRVESMLKDNATAFSEAGNMQFRPKYV